VDVFLIILIQKITRENLEKDYPFEGYTAYYLLFLLVYEKKKFFTTQIESEGERFIWVYGYIGICCGGKNKDKAFQFLDYLEHYTRRKAKSPCIILLAFNCLSNLWEFLLWWHPLSSALCSTKHFPSFKVHTYKQFLFILLFP